MGENQTEEEKAVRDSVVKALRSGSTYYDIENEVSEAVLIATGDNVYCDIHG